MYFNCGSVVDVVKVFQNMLARGLGTRDTMVMQLTKNGCVEDIQWIYLVDLKTWYCNQMTNCFIGWGNASL